ncbi:17-beta-hydroxysteroid dehydrogenase type 3 isoform X3 [Dunckerocampus dactyliophorus]|nr:17-beta-hydroxysteroid dehydrogenase type 3 isoform X3 [Dunckerocampus dactyliophorus]XP_054630708.1 17-beta-hydroxysteroid dehydrogenase type 3 isoform X3 [Dunckerocampus dactyliophorus]
MNVVIMSRTKVTLDHVAKEIGNTTGRKVKVLVTDFTMDNVFSDIEEQLKDLNIGVLVNNVGMLPSIVPCRFLENADLDQTITRVINCNVKTMVKMCKTILPGMENRGRGVILNVSSGIASIPFPLYSLYAASKIFVERFSQGLQAEYKETGIIIQQSSSAVEHTHNNGQARMCSDTNGEEITPSDCETVAPFGVSTRMNSYQATNVVTLSPRDFVKSSLQYVRAGDRTYGSICHMFLGWLLQTLPLKIVYADYVLNGLQEFVARKQAQKRAISALSAA